MSVEVPPSDDQFTPRRGAVAVIVRERRLLVIRRSQLVEAPGMFCFPGGAIQQGEDQQQALVRELAEELGVSVRPLRLLWSSTTRWNVQLNWWQAGLSEQEQPVPDPREVAEIQWLTTQELRALPELLSSNHEFLDALESGEFEIEGL